MIPISIQKSRFEAWTYARMRFGAEASKPCWRSKNPHGRCLGATWRSNLPHRRCFGATWRSKWLLAPAPVPPVGSKKLFEPASAPPVRSKLLFEPASAPPVRSKMLFEPASAPPVRSQWLFKPAVQDHHSKMLVPVTPCSEPLYSAPLGSVHGYARVHTSIYQSLSYSSRVFRKPWGPQRLRLAASRWSWRCVFVHMCK